MNTGIYILLGTNLGNRLQNLMEAKRLLQLQAGKIIIESSVYQTAPWGKTDQPDFFNQVIRIESSASANVLLEIILNIEKQMGRERIEKWGIRIIDIDILLFGEDLINTPSLTVPHPQMPYRKFTLIPLAEIASDVMHPLLKKNVGELLALCSDPLIVTKLS